MTATSPRQRFDPISDFVADLRKVGFFAVGNDVLKGHRPPQWAFDHAAARRDRPGVPELLAKWGEPR